MKDRLKEGDLVSFSCDITAGDWGGGITQDELDALDGRLATITSIEIEEDCDEFSYFDIDFGDTILGGVSGLHLSKR